MASKAHILLALPDALLRRELAALLRKAQYDVTMCRSLSESMRLSNDRPPDLTICATTGTKDQDFEVLAAFKQANAAPMLYVCIDSPNGQPSSDVARKARAAGASDVIFSKQRPGVSMDLGTVLLRKITTLRLPSISSAYSQHASLHGKQARGAGVTRQSNAPSVENAAAVRRSKLERFPIFLIGCSTGGPNALETVLSSLSHDFPAALVVAQHMRPDATRAFTKRLAKAVDVDVKEVTSTQVISPGTCYVAAGGTDLVFLQRNGRFAVTRVPPDPTEPFHPCVDRMVRSAAQVVPGSRLRAVLLTGIGQDGADSMATLYRQGVPTIAESEDTCVVFGMPARLIEKGAASQILPIGEIGNALKDLLQIKARHQQTDAVHEARSKLAQLAQRTARTK